MSEIKPSDVVSMMGKYVRIIPKAGDPIVGLFVGEQRLREYTKSVIFVIQIEEGRRAFISRDEVSYIIVSEAGFVTDKQIPENIDKLFLGESGMKKYICDVCRKEIGVATELTIKGSYVRHYGIYTVEHSSDGLFDNKLELCPDCVGKVMDVLRKC